MTMIRPAIVALMDQVISKYPQMCQLTAEQYADLLVSAANDNVNYCFTYLPEVRHVVWPDHVWRVWKRDHRDVPNGSDR